MGLSSPEERLQAMLHEAGDPFPGSMIYESVRMQAAIHELCLNVVKEGVAAAAALRRVLWGR